MNGFDEVMVPVDGATISVSVGGRGTPVLLLHGFPETKRMWQTIAPVLTSEFSIVCADLRGYGDSSAPPSDADHLPYSKKVLAADMVQVMAALGHGRFSVAGHDRGGRVAYRMAWDHPDNVAKLAVLDVVPVDAVWDRADDRMTLGFWPWSLLAQDAPLPERILTAAADAIIDNALGPQWGSPAATFDADTRAAYAAVLADSAHAHAICEEYRAAATIDREHDAEARRDRPRIACPVLVLWSESGPLSTWYTGDGGPLGLWRTIADDVAGGPVSGGHFFPEEHPARTAATLSRFFAADTR